jgi:hypothetical protein
MTRCLPTPTAGAALFVDAACTQPIGLSSKGACPAYVSTSTAGTCSAPAQEHVWAAGPAFTGTSAYSLSAQACTSYPAAALTSLATTGNLYTIAGAEIANVVRVSVDSGTNERERR